MDAAQRQAARGLLDMAAQRYIPPELRGLLGLVAEANPVVSMDRAGTAAQGLLGRQATPMQRVGYAGDMLSNMAGVVAPAMVASRAGLPAAQALQESVMGFSQAAGIPEFIADESGALRLYHGSPHDFDRFSMDKIVRQFDNPASRAGHWFSTNPDDAAFYGPKIYEVDVSGKFKDAGSMEDEANSVRQRLKEILSRIEKDENANYATEEKLRGLLDSGWTEDPTFYTNVIGSKAAKAKREGFDGLRLKGGETVQDISEAGDNYVVFDENLISIVRKYGIAGAAALYGVSQADIAQAMNPTTDRQTGLLMAQTPPRAD